MEDEEDHSSPDGCPEEVTAFYANGLWADGFGAHGQAGEDRVSSNVCGWKCKGAASESGGTKIAEEIHGD